MGQPFRGLILKFIKSHGEPENSQVFLGFILTKEYEQEQEIIVFP